MPDVRRATSIRLDEGDPVSVSWTDEEYAAIAAKAAEIDRSPNRLIGYILTLACQALDAPGSQHRIDGMGASAAAEVSHLRRAEWIRVVVLETLGLTSIGAQGAYARAELARNPGGAWRD